MAISLALGTMSLDPASPSIPGRVRASIRSLRSLSLAGVIALSILLPGCETSRDRHDRGPTDQERQADQMDEIDRGLVAP